MALVENASHVLTKDYTSMLINFVWINSFTDGGFNKDFSLKAFKTQMSKNMVKSARVDKSVEADFISVSCFD